ncbi:hypothetical protein PR048_007248 [Dryococelus australis]|uniref:Uncharacterized protein n=1 Tax=Dryococelus australis TaxID=614101 RepID=A0ABQ9ID46_9NEOP|nr:hypothetical protein PR048_007248 [Dryococelus australis]
MLTRCNAVYKTGRRLIPPLPVSPSPLVFPNTCVSPAFPPAVVRVDTYDGGSNMSGKFKGVQARITKVQFLAIYSHCANHRLNLAISKA